MQEGRDRSMNIPVLGRFATPPNLYTYGCLFMQCPSRRTNRQLKTHKPLYTLVINHIKTRKNIENKANLDSFKTVLKEINSDKNK